MHRSPSSQQGLTLIELMIALTLGLIAIGALVAVFMSSNLNYRQNEALATVQDNARFALDALSRDLAMAGYWGGIRPLDAAINLKVSAAARSAVAKASAAGDCGPASQGANDYWLFDVRTPVVFRNNTLGSSSIASDFTCLSTSIFQPNSDVLVIRRVSGQAIFSIDANGTRTPATAETTPNRFYVRTNQSTGTLYRAGTTFTLSGPTDCPDSSGVSSICTPTTNPVQVYAYTPQIYYVRNYARNAGDGVPMLCRYYLDDTLATPKMVEDCLAEGVENLQIEWGISTDGSGVVNNYLTNPQPDDLQRAITARIHILVRAPSRNTTASGDAKTFKLGDAPDQTSSDGVLRRVFTTTVQLKNFQPS